MDPREFLERAHKSRWGAGFRAFPAVAASRSPAPGRRVTPGRTRATSFRKRRSGPGGCLPPIPPAAASEKRRPTARRTTIAEHRAPRRSPRCPRHHDGRSPRTSAVPRATGHCQRSGHCPVSAVLRHRLMQSEDACRGRTHDGLQAMILAHRHRGEPCSRDAVGQRGLAGNPDLVPGGAKGPGQRNQGSPRGHGSPHRPRPPHDCRGRCAARRPRCPRAQ